METLRLVLLILHFIGFSAVIGGLLAQLGTPRDERRVTGTVRDGIGVAFVAGLALVGALEAGDDPVNHGKIAVKFGIGLVLLVLIMANARRERIPFGLWVGLLVLAVAEVCVAVLWSPIHQ